MNSCNFTGNLGKDAETRAVGDTTVTSFSIATTAGYGDKKKTTWYDCSYWGRAGEGLAPYLKKGQSVAVSGETWNEEHNGKAYAKMRCVSVTLTGSKQDSQQSPQAAQPAPSIDFDDDIGF